MYVQIMGQDEIKGAMDHTCMWNFHTHIIIDRISLANQGDNALDSVRPFVCLWVWTEKSHYQSGVFVCVSTISRGCGRSAFNSFSSKEGVFYVSWERMCHVWSIANLPHIVKCAFPWPFQRFTHDIFKNCFIWQGLHSMGDFIMLRCYISKKIVDWKECNSEWRILNWKSVSKKLHDKMQTFRGFHLIRSFYEFWNTTHVNFINVSFCLEVKKTFFFSSLTNRSRCHQIVPCFHASHVKTLCELVDSSALRLELAPIQASVHWSQQVHIMSLHGRLLRDIICGNRGLWLAIISLTCINYI